LLLIEKKVLEGISYALHSWKSFSSQDLGNQQPLAEAKQAQL